MTIKHLGGVFGRNPTFNDVTIEGELIFEGGIDINSDLTVDGVTTVRVNSDGATAEAFNVLNNGAGNNTQVRVYFGAGEYNTVGRGLRIDAGRDSGADGIATFYSVDQAEHSDYEAIKILTDGGVTLSHLGNNKLATSSTGVDVTGTVVSAADGGNAARFNRLTSNGSIIELQKDGTTVGSIGSYLGDRLFVGTGDTNLNFHATGDSVYPSGASGNTRDGAIDLGASFSRFKDVYATNGTIQTSDRNEKQDIEELSDAERRVAVAAKGLLRKFRWISAVEEKGDEARIHFGIIAQDLQDAFTAEGLDAGRYGMFIHTTWTDEETGEEHSRMGVRYSELLAFIISAI